MGYREYRLALPAVQREVGDFDMRVQPIPAGGDVAQTDLPVQHLRKLVLDQGLVIVDPGKQYIARAQYRQRQHHIKQNQNPANPSQRRIYNLKHNQPVNAQCQNPLY